MCVEAMDTATSKRVRSGFLRKTAAWKLQWRLVRASASAEEEDDEARRESRAAIRKPLPPLRHHQRRTQLLKLSRALSREEPKPVEECRPLPFLHGHHHHHHPGAMAPENTTQYLMSNAYGDMGEQDGGGAAAAAASQARAHAHCESLSPRSVYAALDCDYDSCLAFQQRDFEEEFGDLWDQ